jgi:F0F1-type ATP synthase membrane subunit b/b'
MLRRINTVLMLSLLALPLSIGGCEKKEKGEKTENPDGAAKGDPVEELKATPNKIQAEIDAVLKPIDDAEALMADLESIPARYELSLADFKGMVQANFAVTEAGAEVELSADLSIDADAKAELAATIQQLKDIKVALATTPDRILVATENIAKIGVDSVALAGEVLVTLTGKAKVAMGDKKAEIDGQIADVMALKDQIPALVKDAQAQLTDLPARAAEIGANFTASFAASAG